MINLSLQPNRWNPLAVWVGRTGFALVNSIPDGQSAAETDGKRRAFRQAGKPVTTDSGGNGTSGTTRGRTDDGALNAAATTNDVADHGTGSGADRDLLAIATLAFSEYGVGRHITGHRVRLAAEGDASDVEPELGLVTLTRRGLRLGHDERNARAGRD